MITLLLPSLPLSERGRYFDACCHAVCVSAALVSVAKAMRCIQCYLVNVRFLNCFCLLILFRFSADSLRVFLRFMIIFIINFAAA